MLLSTHSHKCPAVIDESRKKCEVKRPYKTNIPEDTMIKFKDRESNKGRDAMGGRLRTSDSKNKSATSVGPLSLRLGSLRSEGLDPPPPAADEAMGASG